MEKNQKNAFILIGLGLFFSIFIHLGVMFDKIPFKQTYILYINVFLILSLWPAMSISKNSVSDSDVQIENMFKTVWEVFPLWLSVGLGAILVYSVLVFINFTYIDDLLADRPDIAKVVIKLSKGSSAATMFFYASAFGLLNLNWRVKKEAEENELEGEIKESAMGGSHRMK